MRATTVAALFFTTAILVQPKEPPPYEKAVLVQMDSSACSPDYSVVAAPSGSAITGGQMANFSVSAAPSGEFNQTVSWTCTGAPMASICAVSPTNAATAAVSVSTTMRSGAILTGKPRFVLPPLPWQALPLSISWLLLGLTFDRSRGIPRARLWLTASAVLLLGGFCVSCGGGSYTGSGPPPKQEAPAATDTIPVTGTSGSLSHSASYKLIVN